MKITLQYFYHPDHLGSASFVTNENGAVCQHLQYLPFGEIFVSQRNSEFDSRYKFTAKELDNETSYTYFGARYYDSDISVWLSADPMSDMRSWESPYSYCGNNPIIRIDNIGLIWDITELSEEQQKIWNNNIDEICSQRSLFKKKFDQLDKSDVVYKLKI